MTRLQVPRKFGALCLCLAMSPIIQAQSAPVSETDQDNIIVVMDTSGSMRERMPKSNKTRMEAAKEALLTVLQSLPPTTNVGILIFKSDKVQNDWIYPLKPVDPVALAKAVNAPQPNGGTPLGAYLKKGTDALLKQRRSQHGFGTYRLLVVTDGKASDQPLVNKYLPDVLSRGVTVDVIGVDMAPDLSLATHVHSYRRADNPESLVEAVKNVLAEVGADANDSAGSAEDFALIAPIPDQMATAMLAALANVADHPIGESPPPPPTASTPIPTAPPPEQYDPFAPGLPPTPANERGFGSRLLGLLGNLCFFGFIFLVIAGFILVQIGRAAQRRDRR